MDLKRFRENIGTIIKLRPRPKAEGAWVKDSYNEWVVIDEVEDTVFLLKNRSTNHEISLRKDNIREFRSPRFLLLNGQVFLEKGGVVRFEPTTPGLSGPDDLSALLDLPVTIQRSPVYEALNPYVGREVTLWFPPDKSGSEYGSHTCIVEECTPLYVTLVEPGIIIKMPNWIKAPGSSDPVIHSVPETKKSVPLQQLQIAQDTEKNRPLIIIDHALWDRDLF
jgi:hypothetical protein